MSPRLRAHADKLKNSEHIHELDNLANAKNRHAAYIYLTHLQPSHFLHIKNAAREHLASEGKANEHTYFEYPQIVLFDDADYPHLDKLAHPAVGFHQVVDELEADNITGGGFWRTLKKTAHKAAKVYSKINSGVNAVATIVSKLPLPPKFQMMAEALKTGTDMHKKVADLVANATGDNKHSNELPAASEPIDNDDGYDDDVDDVDDVDE